VFDYDYIIAGAGAAGLNLAHALGRGGFGDARVLLIDRDGKTSNDRTWCFWESGENVLEPIVHRRWGELAFHGVGFSQVLRPQPYYYKMLRGIDFYEHMRSWLRAQPSVQVLRGEVAYIEETADGGGAAVWVRERCFRARYVFSSLTPPLPADARHHNFLQHFLGWVIRVPDARFDPGVATLMDFRIEQSGDTRFVYVLPLDEQRALVEYTVFSESLLPRDAYAPPLRRYIEQQLGIERYEIEHEEYGVIPMSDAPYVRRPSPHVMNIGVAGGASKPSTGYTFVRTQRQAARIVEALRRTGEPFYSDELASRRFGIFDSTLLNVLSNRRVSGAQVFTDLFRRNPAARILRFLDEDTRIDEDLRIMSSVHIPEFTRALAVVLKKRLQRDHRNLR
jgi:lycopene beta-cyclase